MIIVMIISHGRKKSKKKNNLKFFYKGSLLSITVDALEGEETDLVLNSGRESEPVGLELNKWSH